MCHLVLIFATSFVAANNSLTSPNGLIRFEFQLQASGKAKSVPHYHVLFRDREIIGYSPLGLRLANDQLIGEATEIISSEIRKVRSDYKQVTGKRSHVVADGMELILQLRETTEPKRKWELHVRAENDGVAFRYHFPKQANWDQLDIEQELTEFHCAAETKSYALPLNSYTSSYEKRYEVKKLHELPKKWLLGLPLLLEYPSGVFASITEANVHEYAGMYLAPAGDGRLQSRLSPWPHEPNVAVRAALPHSSPWRVIMIADRVGALVESNLILNLNEPCQIADTSWIKTGKTTFPWWNGFYEENVDFKPGLNTATAKHYIDFCAKAGIPYHSLDGVGNTAWYSGPIVPYKGADPTQAISGLDLPEVLRYAKSQGVRMRFWMNWQAAEKYMDKAFPLYREWGVEGVMLDFMDRDDQHMNRFVRRAVKLAADNQLTVTLHGCPKPTGLERTFPNLLSHEGVMNLEYDKWDKLGITPEHETIVPFTRMLAGPLDFHQGSFRTVKMTDFKPRNNAPLVIGTPSRTLASYVVYQNHLSMVADYPSAYRDHPGLPLLSAIPTTWDDTKVLHAQIGECVVIARRHGAEWHIGAMNGREARTIDVPLGFLQASDQHEIQLASDDEAAKYGLTIRKEVASQQLKLQLAAAGGAYARIKPKHQ